MKVENGKWKVGNRKWEVENEKWKVSGLVPFAVVRVAPNNVKVRSINFPK